MPNVKPQETEEDTLKGGTSAANYLLGLRDDERFLRFVQFRLVQFLLFRYFFLLCLEFVH